MKARIFNIMQYEKHPTTGAELISEQQIKVALAHKSIRQHAYILHDADVYSLKDQADHPEHVAGQLKPRHWHIVCRCANAVDTAVIAKWFGIPENFVEVPKGHGAFLDCVEYLSHEDEAQQRQGKTLYSDDKIRANFDFRVELQKREEQKLRYGCELNTRDQFRYDVLYNGKTLRECEHEDRINFMNDLDRLKKLRLEFLIRQKPPMSRVNYYISGKGGVGKDLISRAVARSLFPQLEDDEDIFFIVGAGGVTFDGYDGQPVVIWSDKRAKQLLQELSGQGNLYNIFETHPHKQRQSVKYGIVNLCNVVNIVNGPQTYTEFFDEIAASENKGQSYRRFPMVIPLHEEDFDILLNRGFIENDTRLFEEYISYNGFRGNMLNIIVDCNGDESSDLYRRISQKTVSPITSRHNEVLEATARILSEEDVLAKYEDVGLTEEEIKQKHGGVADEKSDD